MCSELRHDQTVLCAQLLKWRIRKTYPVEQIMTPWDRLRTIPDFEQYLEPGITVRTLSDTAMAMTDSQAAQKLQDMRRNLFASFRRKRA
ncbi:MAG: hypothetical protein EPN70_22800 [Paraburkholderia sp.]|uniref:hypothetical protein n=1 Tax=Paraburkholderia sp. TaxID=1926495 RepID=UPI0012176F6C|nr:hypothetical protein [Paraburkholderia sp.]TAM00385.1 MAG: hypothetical protein EPN70_22800 [Paraburkholderia sp.]